MAVKYNLDRAVAWWGFHRPWYFWNYIKPHGFAAVDAVPPDDRAFYVILLLSSLPFLAAGMFLTIRRLRSANLPLELCILFFVPVLNLIFFLILSCIPTRGSPASPVIGPRWISLLPSSAVGSALVATILVGPLGVGLAILSTQGLRNYGWGLFVALPFTMGLVSVLIYAGPQKRSFGSCLLVSMLPVVFAGLSMFVLAAEGAICLIMAAPIGLALALMGGIVGYLIVGNRAAPISPAAMILLLFAVPLTMGMEKNADNSPPLLSVTTSVIVDAPPEQVWPNVVSFSPIPPERDWVLHTGVAYPMRSKMVGVGVGAVRHCIFNTGEFIEPIEVWDEPHLLRFSVAEQPEPMEELSPYPHIKTPHLHGYLQSQQGELRLTALPNGKTLLEGTTWYTDRIWPSQYWQLWSDMIIHHIHLRVLNHIKTISEAAAARTNVPSS
jgi:hypothetical protein